MRSWTPAARAASRTFAGGRLQIEVCNIDRDAALEQFDVLRQIAHALTQRFGGPVVERRLVELDLPRTRGRTPISACAKVDLPDPLGPMIPTASPLRTETDRRLGLTSPSRAPQRAAGQRPGLSSAPPGRAHYLLIIFIYIRTSIETLNI
jgi:hypothetical protein